jgi:hypothetical protein
MKLIGTYKDMGYAHWASYIINGDCSGLDDEEIEAAEDWLIYNMRAPIDTGEEFEFTRDVPGLPGAGLEYVFPVYEGDYPDGPEFWDPIIPETQEEK